MDYGEYLLIGNCYGFLVNGKTSFRKAVFGILGCIERISSVYFRILAGSRCSAFLTVLFGFPSNFNLDMALNLCNPFF